MAETVRASEVVDINLCRRGLRESLSLCFSIRCIVLVITQTERIG